MFYIKVSDTSHYPGADPGFSKGDTQNSVRRRKAKAGRCIRNSSLINTWSTDCIVPKTPQEREALLYIVIGSEGPFLGHRKGYRGTNAANAVV